MTFERQPDALPTNKAAVSAAVAAAIVLHTEPVVAEIWPQIAPALLSGPSVTSAIAWGAGFLAALAVTWFVPDRAGVST